LVVRHRRPGDRIAPLGMRGSRKVQDVLTDAKVPAALRDRLPLLACGNEVVWVPGYRVAARYAVPDDGAPALLVTLERVCPVVRLTRGGRCPQNEPLTRLLPRFRR